MRPKHNARKLPLFALGPTQATSWTPFAAAEAIGHVHRMSVRLLPKLNVDRDCTPKSALVSVTRAPRHERDAAPPFQQLRRRRAASLSAPRRKRAARNREGRGPQPRRERRRLKRRGPNAIRMAQAAWCSNTPRRVHARNAGRRAACRGRGRKGARS